MQTHVVTGGGGIQLSVDETGNPEGRAVLFIHGFSQCRLAWRKQMSSSLAQDLRLVAMDIRGHGLSDKPRDAYGESKLWAEDVHAVIQSLGLDRPVLVGWSYGGLVICDYLRSHGQESIGGINLVGAASKLGTDAALAVITPEFLSLVPGFFSDDVKESTTSLEGLLRLAMYGEPAEEDLYFMLGNSVVVLPHVRQGLLSRSLDNDDLLPRISKPALITHGEKDAVVLPKAGQDHAAAMPNARISLYPDTGHTPFWEAPDRFNNELRAFAEAT